MSKPGERGSVKMFSQKSKHRTQGTVDNDIASHMDCSVYNNTL